MRSRHGQGPLRVAFPFSQLQIGGAELRAVRLAERLPHDRFAPTFISSSGEGALDRQARDAGARVVYAGSRPLAGLPLAVKSIGRLRKLAKSVAHIRASRYDIVNAWLYPADVLAIFERPMTGVPIIVAGRFDQLPRDAFGPLSSAIDAIVNPRVDAIVTNSEVVAEQERGRTGIDPGKLHVIRNGVEIHEPLPADERRRARSELGASEGDLIVGAVGMLREIKRHDLLIDAFADVSRTRPELHLVIVGEGPMRQPLMQQVKRLGLESRVLLPGAIADIRPMLEAFDVVAMSSSGEGLPNALLEAAAAKKPIVTTAAGGAVEIVDDGVNGLVVPVGDRVALSEALACLVGDEQLRRQYGAAGRQRVQTLFGMDRFAREWAALYEQLAVAKGLLLDR